MIQFILGRSLALTAAFQGLGCLQGWYCGRSEKQYDVIGAMNSLSFVPLALYYSDKFVDPRKVIISTLFVTARLWLLIFLGWRAKERGGDDRFEKFKTSFGKWAIPWFVQGLWVWFIALPALIVNAGPSVAMGTSDIIFSGLFLSGLFFEILGDIQKAQWVKEGRKGGFCDTGLWKFSRHPNYFGEILMWWSAWGLTLSVGAATSHIWTFLALLSPLFTMRILMFTPSTGLMQCEGGGLKRYYMGDQEVAKRYKEYRRETSVLLPMVGYKYVPNFLKSTLLCEWPMYAFDEERAKRKKD